MAISTLASLKEKSLIYFKDRQDLSDFIQDGVDLATDYFSQRLRVREMMSLASLETPGNGEFPLPDDFIEVISVLEDIGHPTPIEYMTSIGVRNNYSSNSAGRTYNYNIEGGYLMTYPLTTNAIIIQYYSKIPALVADDDTNWLLQKFPNLYLDYCRMFAADIAEDPNEAKYGAKVDAFIDMLNERDMTARYARVTTDLSDEVMVP